MSMNLFNMPPAASIPPPVVRQQLTIQERFERFDAAHPEVYAEFKRLAHILLRKHEAGKVKWVSAKHIIERMRADYYFRDDTSDIEEYKLSNDFTSRYARKLIAECPVFEGVFRLRQLEAE